MSGKPAFWFPAKRYGWGWGFPVRWQGWLVFAGYVALLYTGIYYFFEPRRDALGLTVYILVLTAVLVGIVALKGERPLAWRWGKR
jgi:hypothetical protein